MSFKIIGGPKPNLGCSIIISKTMDNSFRVFKHIGKKLEQDMFLLEYATITLDVHGDSL